MTTDVLPSHMNKLGRVYISTWEENTSGETLPLSWNEMTTEGREKVEVAVYKEHMTTCDERILMHDESGQDTSNTSLIFVHTIVLDCLSPPVSDQDPCPLPVTVWYGILPPGRWTEFETGPPKS